MLKNRKSCGKRPIDKEKALQTLKLGEEDHGRAVQKERKQKHNEFEIYQLHQQKLKMNVGSAIIR